MRLVAIYMFVLFSIIACKHSPDTSVFSEGEVRKPEIFMPGIISTDNNEFDICFSPDTKTIYFTRRIEEEVQKIYVTKYVDEQWIEPVIASFSTDRDETPFITPDGNTLYFGSEREIPGRPNLGGFDMNIWKTEWQDGSWGTPEPLPEPINYVQIEGEQWPSSNNNFLFTLDGEEHFYTTKNRGDLGIELYSIALKNGQWLEPEKITGLFDSLGLWKYSASISPDGNYLVFNSYAAPGGEGGEDLYVSQKKETGWSKAVNIGELINTGGEESSGRFSPDGKYFFFTHSDNLGEDEYGPWNIYFIETASIGLEKLFQVED